MASLPNLETMIQNAKMRASALSNLDNKYGASAALAARAATASPRHPGNSRLSGQKRPSSALSSSSPHHDSSKKSGGLRLGSGGTENREAMIGQLQTLLNDRSDKLKYKMIDQLSGKSLVLEINKPTKSRTMKIKRSSSSPLSLIPTGWWRVASASRIKNWKRRRN